MDESFLTAGELKIGDVFCRIDGILDRNNSQLIFRKELDGYSRLVLVRRDCENGWTGPNPDTNFVVKWINDADYKKVKDHNLVIKLDFWRGYISVSI
jgi:hypothetical protein